MRRIIYSLGFLFVLLMASPFAKAQQRIFSEDFEGATFPPSGWTIVNNSAGNKWTQNTTATYAFSGTKSMTYGYNFTNAADAWAFTPNINLNTNPVTITFYVRVRSATYPENLKVTIASDTVIANQTDVLFDSTGLKNTTYYKWQTTYTPQFPGDYVLGFNCYSPANMWNLYVDSISVYQLLPTCTGTPFAGIVTGPNALCPSTSFTLTDSLVSVANGITYQWQQSIDSINWTNIIGANSTSLSAILNGTTYYRNKTVCTASKDSVYSNVFKVTQNPVSQCYCGPNTGIILHSATGPTIDSVAIVGTTLDNNDIGATNSNGYTQFPANTNTTADLEQGKQYTLSTVFAGGTAIGSVWFDWNHNGKFDSSEWKQITTSGAGLVTINFSVPSNAILGNTGMRVRARVSGSPNGIGDPCTSFGSGETEDYIINVIQGVQCTGKPSAGVITSIKSICAGLTFTLTDSGASVASGINYKWEQSLDSLTWSVVPNSNTQNITSSITVPTWFRMKAVCSSSNDSSTSNLVKVNITPFVLCGYCSPNNGTTLHSSTSPTIDSVAIDGSTLNNKSVGAPTNGYTQFPIGGNTTATLVQGQSYNLTVLFSGAATSSVWFDWNQNGKYDSSEWTQISLTGSGLNNITFKVSDTAKLGLTGMRVRARVSGSPNGIGDPCTTFGSGETEEYFVTVVKGASCSGSPNAGTITGDNLVCPGTVLQIKDSGASVGIGIAYQWQYSTNGGSSWVSPLGANTSTYKPTVTNATWFRFKVTCSATNDSVFSNIIKVALNTASNCYCGPKTGLTLHSGTSTASIDSVTIVGTTLNNANKGAATGGYTLFPDTLNTTGSLTQGLAYNLVTKFGASSISSVWIDWDQSGTYDSSEWVQIATSGTGPVTTSVQVPANAKIGKTNMRLRSRNAFFANGFGSACAVFTNGETEDYVITVLAGVQCTGKPNAGTISGTNAVCSGVSFTLSDTLYSNAPGISYQWQVSTDSLIWVDITGAVKNKLTSNLVTTSYYRFKVVCAASKDSSYTPGFKVSLNPSSLCYCSPSNGTTLHSSTGPTIDSVSISATTLNNGSVGAPTNGYTAFPANGNTTGKLSQGLQYTLTTKLSALATTSLWIDYDQNGKYDSSEWTLVTASGSGLVQVSFTVPFTSKLGLTGLRIRARTSGALNGPKDACTTFGSGETEDYIIKIDSGTTCSGTPIAGKIFGQNLVCSGTNFNLIDTGSSFATGIAYQWQTSLDSINWSDVPTATSPSYSATIAVPTFFRFKVVCNTSKDSAYSNILFVNLAPSTLCYCGPNTGVVLHTTGAGPTIDSVSIVGTTLANYSPGSNSNGYSIFLPAPNTTANLAQKGVYTLRTKFSASAVSSVWIDWNQNGKFDSSEWVRIATTGTGPFATTITVPATAKTGLTGLRIRTRGTFLANGAINACTQFTNGETEDYFITVTAPDSCTGKPFAGMVYGPSAVASGATFTLTDTGSTNLLGISGQWEYSLDNITWGDLTGAVTPSLTFSTTTQIWFRYKVYCSVSNDTSYSNVWSVSILVPIALRSFNGENKGSVNYIKWVTATEQNNSGFQLLRSSNGKTFEPISFIASKSRGGNSVQLLEYQFTDEQPLANGYYQLRQLDLDGKSTLSSVINIRTRSISELTIASVYPNPTLDWLNVSIMSPVSKAIDLVVTDLAGKVVLRKQVEVKVNDNTIKLDVRSLVGSNYLLKAVCKDGCQTSVVRFFKK